MLRGFESWQYLCLHGCLLILAPDCPLSWHLAQARSSSWCPAICGQLFRRTPCSEPCELLRVSDVTKAPFWWLWGSGDRLSAYGVNQSICFWFWLMGSGSLGLRWCMRGLQDVSVHVNHQGENADSDLAGPGCGLRVCISNLLTGGRSKDLTLSGRDQESLRAQFKACLCRGSYAAWVP